MKEQRYSLGIQDFSELRLRNCVYVDKTELVYQLIMQNKTYFLSHPRRFGKSLLVSILEYLFLGRKDLFEGLWIEDKIAWDTYPVLHFSFIESGFHTIGFEKYLHIKIDEQAKSYDITLENTDISNKVRELIVKLNEKHHKQVVFLVDEYDKPITEFLRQEQLQTADKNRELMRLFYSPLKELDKYLRFVFITGVSKFSKVSVFSDLNHLEDLTIGKDFATLLGYTEEEIEHYFHEKIAQIAQEMELTYEACFAKMRLWYNGYSWNAGKDKVYNPTSVMKFLRNRDFENYWFETGSPLFLIQMMSENFTYNVEDLQVEENILKNFDIEAIDDITLLFQTGYLTIKAKEDGIFTLTYPNQEVRDSMLQYLLRAYSHKRNTKPLILEMFKTLAKRDFAHLFKIFNSILGELPYQIFDTKQEKYYQAIIFLTFRLLGYYAQAEPSVSEDRIDAVVETQDGIFIFEFKVNGTIEDAMAQIHENRYYQRYEASEKEIYLLGAVCQEKEIKEYKWEKFES
ncbi:MAG: ATP-binding protein [Microscillaceae bacterium]|jgi:hypothetical protein|nr:ATP-binding protein [Microscillaceae bacterium]